MGVFEDREDGWRARDRGQGGEWREMGPEMKAGTGGCTYDPWRNLKPGLAHSKHSRKGSDSWCSRNFFPFPRSVRGGCCGGGRGEEISQYNHSLGQLPQPVSLVMLGRLGLQANWSSVPPPDGLSPIDTPIQGPSQPRGGVGGSSQSGTRRCVASSPRKL